MIWVARERIERISRPDHETPAIRTLLPPVCGPRGIAKIGSAGLVAATLVKSA